MTGTHIKRGGFGLIPPGLRMVYYCPVENDKVKLKADYVNYCPICGKSVRWEE